MPISMAVNSAPNNQLAAPEAAKTEAKNPAKPEPKKDRAYFSRAIEKATIAFYRSGKAVADLLLEARLKLSPEDFQAFIKDDCQFDSSLVYKFIKMAADFRLNDPANDPILPEAWTTRYEIMQMKEATFRMGVKSGIINADCKLADLKKLRDQVEGSKGKKAGSNKTAARKKTAKTETAPVAADQAPTSTVPLVSDVRPGTQQAVLKASVNTSALKGVGTATGVATAPAKGRIAIVLSKAVAGQHKADLDRLKEGIEALVKEYDFIGAVEVEVAA